MRNDDRLPQSPPIEVSPRDYQRILEACGQPVLQYSLDGQNFHVVGHIKSLNVEVDPPPAPPWEEYVSPKVATFTFEIALAPKQLPFEGPRCGACGSCDVETIEDTASGRELVSRCCDCNWMAEIIHRSSEQAPSSE